MSERQKCQSERCHQRDRMLRNLYAMKAEMAMRQKCKRDRNF